MNKNVFKRTFVSFLLSLFLLCFSNTIRSQTIVYTIDGGSGLCGGIYTLTFTLAGMINGKNYYTLNVIGQPISYITWTGTKWEISAVFAGRQFTNTAATLLNPPCFNVGTFINTSLFCPDARIIASSGSCETVAIPVELVHFFANMAQNSVELTWTTASEINNKGFQIERSEDGFNFNTLDFVKGKGTTQAFSFYKLTDKNVVLGMNYYYRLNQIDDDGKENMSKIVSVKTGEKNKFSFSPNPAHMDLTINVHGEKATIRVFDLLGKVVLSKSILENNALTTMDISALQAGSYIIETTINNLVFREKMLKQ
jgi:hypothetical protein